ncbi:tetratricopeptide repeat protein, partial [Escherichia coli]|nr:tetratricopeptide repeat protein [Escherichia coli]
SLEPQNPAANLVLANALFDARDYVSAAEYYSKVLEIDPSNLNARTDLGTTFVERQQPDFERAIVEYEKVLQQDPKNEP